MNTNNIDKILSGEISHFENQYLLEDVLLYLKQIEDIKKTISEEKEKICSDYDEKINHIEETSSKLRTFIKNTLEKTNVENVSFEGVGLISLSSGREKWVVEDEDELNKLLDSLPDEEKNEIVKVKVQTEIAKRGLDDLLNKLEIENNVPSCVKKLKGDNTIKIRYGK